MYQKIKKTLDFDFKKQEKKILLIFTLGLLFYAALVLFGDTKKIISISFSFKWNVVILLLLLSLFNYLVRFVRWHYFLHQISIKIPFANSLRIFLAGLSMTVTPGKMGEVVKAYLIKKETGNKFAQMIPLLITERLTDGIGMLLLALGGIYLFRQSAIFFLFSLSIVLCFFLFVYYKRHTLKLIRKLEDKIGHIKALDFFLTFFENSEKLLRSKQLTIGILLSIIAWSFEGISLFLLINNFGSFWRWSSFFYALFIFSFSSIAGFLVLIPGGIGVAEGSITSLLTLFFQIGLPQAIFITLIFRFVTLWFGVLLGLANLLLSFSKLRLSEEEGR
ncbi:flippase-like domain-containing protein [Candidatus Roizmanbacteria bacterium]|nr:flippase-like domain-containing protein [Candidatus Roizmanbacteria bacterium]